MKIAVCISGQLRGDEQQWGKIVEKFSRYECDYYFSIWDSMGGTTAIDRVIPPGYLSYFFPELELKKFKIDEFGRKFPFLFEELFLGKKVNEEILKKIFSSNRIEIEVSPENFLNEKIFADVKYPLFLQKRNPRDVNCLLMFYKIWSCFEMVKKSGILYDRVVRLRSDLDLGDWDGDLENLSDGIFVKKTAIDDHVDDQFAVGCYEDMEIYSRLWENLKIYWEEPQSERSIYEVSGFLLSRYLKEKNVKVIKKDYPFSLKISRKSNQEFLDLIFLELVSKNFSDEILINVAKEMVCDLFCDGLHKESIQTTEKLESFSSNFIKKFKVPSFQLLGFLKERDQDYQLAISYYHQALAEDFKSFSSYCGLARIHQKLNNFELSVSAWTAALSVRADNWICMREISKINLISGRPEIAKFWLEKAKKISRNHPSVISLEKSMD
jgi:tetratricopeptide (TPR) repeat protein